MNRISIINPQNENDILIRRITIGILAFINSFAVRYLYCFENTTYYYVGTSNYGCNLICILSFGLCCIVLNRFLRSEVLNNKKHIILAVLFSWLIGVTAVIGEFTLYPGGTHFMEEVSNIWCIILVPLGLNILMIPIMSELILFLDRLREKGIKSEEEEPLKKGWLYFICMWLGLFAAFLPLFILYWPVNFVYDAAYQVRDYCFNTMSTHHPLMHTWLLGKCYSYGMSIGDVNKGMQIYTIIQILILSGAFAFLMYYLRKSNVRKLYRIIILLMIVLNPANHYFAVTTSKETLCGAFSVAALTAAMDLMHEAKSKWQYAFKAIVFIAFSIMACQFRNNMIYAYAAGGVLIFIIRKGWKNKAFVAALILCVFLGNTVTTTALIKATNAKNITNHKESMSLPLQCLVRVMLYHGDELPEEIYEPLHLLLTDDVMENYAVFISDGVKESIDIDVFETGIRTYLSLWVKLAFKYPGIYIEQFAGQTIGYWYPLNFPYWTGGLTMLANMAMMNDMEPIVNSSLIPGGMTWVLKFDGIDTGRLNYPLLGWTFRGALYTWAFLFAFGYAVYTKNRRALMLIAIPLCYLGTSFLGPVSWFRYLYINIALLPMLFIWVLNKDE